LPHGGEFMLPS